MTEGGSSDSISVVLSSQPNTKVRITFTSADTGEVTVSSSALTFDASNWDTPQNLNLLPVTDNEDDDNRSRLPAQLIRDSPMTRNMMRL